jgi:hypothetical protein
MKSARILVPTGIGDIYWVLVKLKAFCQRYGITRKPSISVLCDHGSVGYKRSIQLLKMVSSIKLGDPPTVPLDKELPRPGHINDIYREAFNENGRTAFPGFYGYDWFISYNGVINSGNWLDDCDSLECNWYPELNLGDDPDGTHYRNLYEKYATFYFTFNGNYIDYHLKQFDLDKLAEAIRKIMVNLRLTPVFIGAEWDLKYNGYLSQLVNMVPGAVNLVGQTSLDQAFRVIMGSEIVVGYHSGLTNIGVMLGKKSVLLWPSTLPLGHIFPASVPLAVVPPETRFKTYHPVFTGGLTVDRLVGEVSSLHKGKDT